MQRQTTSMRTAAARIVSLASGLAVAGPAPAGRTSWRTIDWPSYLDWHSYTDWRRLVLVASILLLVAALVLQAFRPATSKDDAELTFSHWQRIGNMPIRPPASVESVP